MTPTSTLLPPYELRSSGRSRRVRLVITPRNGLTVVTPEGFDPELVPDIVRDRLDWVTHHLERAQSMRREAELPPASVELRAVGRELSVRYRLAGRFGAARRDVSPQAGHVPDAREPAGGVRVRASGERSLDVSGNIAARESVGLALRAWLKREAARELPILLEAESRRTGLTYSTVSVRLQRTRWGSCSAKGGISLNARLLFLPPEIARYVLAHELAHTVHLNHSEKYWRFLESIHPGALALDRQLRTARRYVPFWAQG
ncbi:M48 family metallopeptidase [Fundidesulfovibrio terrae]|uniref:M48 family metallopeptidase n=1 Tax=Fundidesulfovibrio terrae TaxID=2922866 RepID=UPI001FAF1862